MLLGEKEKVVGNIFPNASKEMNVEDSQECCLIRE